MTLRPLDRDMAEQVARELDAMSNALADGRASYEAIGAVLGVQPSQELRALIMLSCDNAKGVAPRYDPLNPESLTAHVFSGFSAGVALGAAIMRVQARAS